jgi:hypothetical protein
MAQRHRGIFYNTGKLVQEGCQKRTCGHCGVEGHCVLNCPELHEVRDFVTSFTPEGEALCHSEDLAWLRALPAKWNERPQSLFTEEESPHPSPLQKVPALSVAEPTAESTSSTLASATHLAHITPAQVSRNTFAQEHIFQL